MDFYEFNLSYSGYIIDFYELYDYDKDFLVCRACYTQFADTEEGTWEGDWDEEEWDDDWDDGDWDDWDENGWKEDNGTHTPIPEKEILPSLPLEPAAPIPTILEIGSGEHAPIQFHALAPKSERWKDDKAVQGLNIKEEWDKGPGIRKEKVTKYTAL